MGWQLPSEAINDWQSSKQASQNWIENKCQWWIQRLYLVHPCLVSKLFLQWIVAPGWWLGYECGISMRSRSYCWILVLPPFLWASKSCVSYSNLYIWSFPGVIKIGSIILGQNLPIRSQGVMFLSLIAPMGMQNRLDHMGHLGIASSNL